MLYRMNAQLRPILDLLREVENISLSSDVLEPELHSIQQVGGRVCMYSYNMYTCTYAYTQCSITQTSKCTNK